MTYRELLKICKEKPGCIKTRWQIEADQAVKKAQMEKLINEEMRKKNDTRRKK